ncbi:MAG: glycosyl hydrolase 53 family protein [Clostridiales bacterium]
MNWFNKKITVTLVILIFITPFATSLLYGGKSTSNDIHINPIRSLNKNFIKGVDISMLAEIEKNGGKFFDEKGNEVDCFKILKNHGVNYVRLRVWNNPVYNEDILDDKGNIIYAKGDPLGGGNNNKDVTIALAKRAKKHGMKILLDFHYSDWWADPSKQNKPSEWEELTQEEIEVALYEYTKDVLLGLKKSKAIPSMVQIGNEVNGGIVWPNGKTWMESTDTEIGGYEGFTGLLKQGARAIREICPKKTKITIHLSNGGKNELYVRVFNELIKKEVDFDVIGMSYYPYWHGTLDQLKSNMEDLATRYRKELVIAETAYAYTLENGDNLSNIFSKNNINAGGYKATVQGQATAIRNIMEVVSDIDRGLGVFYWEPDWIPVDGVGWKTGEGNAWENQAMFDFNGKVLPSLDIFKVGRRGKYIESVISNVPETNIITNLGKYFVLPDSIKVDYSDDSIKSVPIAWDEYDESNLNQVGTFVIKGSIEGTNLKAFANITVDSNCVTDKGFESGNLDNWNVTGDTTALAVENNTGNAYSGDYSLKYWLGEPFSFNCSQTITDIPDGTYSLRVWSSGGGGEELMQLFAKDYGGEELNVDIVNTGWLNWAQYEINNIEVIGGSCTVGINLESSGGNWGNIDDIEFILEE